MFVRYRVFLFCFVLALSSATVYSADWTWDGGSTNSSDWSDATNWVGDSSVPVSDPGTDLFFDNASSRISCSNDMGSFQFHDFIFLGINDLSVWGDDLEVFRSLVNSSTVSQVLHNDISLGADATFRANGGILYFLGEINNAGHTLRTEGTKDVYFMNALSGSGGLDVYSTGTTILSESNSYSGATRVNGGVLKCYDGSLRGTPSLVVQNAGTATLSGATELFSASSAGRQAKVSGTNSLLTMWGGTVDGTSNILQVTAGGHLDTMNLSFSGGQGHALLVDGPGSCFSEDNTLSMTGSSMRLWVTNGGRADFPLYSLRTTNSHVLVSGSGSMITGYSLRVRNGGRGNRIEVLNGGTMDLSGNLVLEGAEGTLWVQGAGSELHVPDLYIQNGGGGNEVNISTGALLDVVSFAVLTTNNRFSVTGTGTVVGGISSIGSFYLAGSSNVTEIKDGATIYITPQVMGMNNEMRISGASILSLNTMVLQGSQNRLTVSNASIVEATWLIIGGENENHMRITGAGTVFSNRQYTSMNGGTGNVFEVVDGAEYRTPYFYASTENGQILISDPGTRFIAGGITSRITGSSSGFVVSNGAEVISGNALLGGAVTSVITGAGTKWRNDAVFYADGPVRVSDGAQVQTMETRVNAGGEFMATGSGTIWSNAGAAYIGDSGENASIRVLNQSVAIMSNLVIGGSGGGSNNTVRVQGGGLISAMEIDVGGGSGSHNALNILSGGEVTADTLEIRGGGELLMNGGELTVNSLSKTSELFGGSGEFNAGTLNVSNTEYASLTPFEVGDGAQSATLNMMGDSNNTHRFNGGLIIGSNATLEGEGTIYADVEIKGTLSPGHSAGAIIVENSLALDDNAEAYIEIYGEDDFDYVEADSIDYGGLLNVHFSGSGWTNGARFQVFDANTHSGSFSSTNVSGVYAAGFDTDSGEVYIIAVIPEAATCALFAMGFLLLWRWRRSSR